MSSAMISDRDKQIRDIRPEVNGKGKEPTDKIQEFFETVMMPVILLQNSIIIAQFKHYVKMFKPAFNAYNQQVQRNYIQDALRSDPRIRNSLIASVISMLTIPEYDFYCENKSSLNDLIITRITHQVQDQLERLL